MPKPFMKQKSALRASLRKSLTLSCLTLQVSLSARFCMGLDGSFCSTLSGQKAVGTYAVANSVCPKTKEAMVGTLERWTLWFHQLQFDLTGFEVSWSTLALELTSVYDTMYPT